jgi:hypothetical protein
MTSKYGYIGYGPDTSPVIVAKQVFSPTGVQTNFTFAAGYQIGYLDVYLNGARQIEGQDFSATDTSTVGLSTAAQSGDVLELVAYKAYNLAVPNAPGNFSVGGNLDVTGIINATTFSGNASSATYANSAGIASTATAAGTAYGLTGSPDITVNTLISNETRTITGAEKIYRTSGNTINLAYSSNTGANIGYTTNPTGDIAVNVTGIPTSSVFDDYSITFAVIVNNTGTACTCTSINLNGVSRTIRWVGGSLSSALVGVTTTSGHTIFSFTGINTVGSASTTSNYQVFGSANGGYW